MSIEEICINPEEITCKNLSRCFYYYGKKRQSIWLRMSEKSKMQFATYVFDNKAKNEIDFYLLEYDKKSNQVYAILKIAINPNKKIVICDLGNNKSWFLGNHNYTNYQSIPWKILSDCVHLTLFSGGEVHFTDKNKEHHFTERSYDLNNISKPIQLAVFHPLKDIEKYPEYKSKQLKDGIIINNNNDFADTVYEIGLVKSDPAGRADGYKIGDVEEYERYLNGQRVCRNYLILKSNLISYAVYIALFPRDEKLKDYQGWFFKQVDYK